MEKDRALKYLRTSFKVPSEYLGKIPKNYIEMIEKLISKNSKDRPTAEDLLKQEFMDPENNASSLSLAQYTYYLDYPDYKCSFNAYSKQSEMLNLVIKSCKSIFEKHGATFMETAMFKPISNSFTIFMHKFDNGLSGDITKMGKKKSKKKTKLQEGYDSNNESEYVKIDYQTCEPINNSKEQFSFEKQ
jgi:serine/threonine protein kinase